MTIQPHWKSGWHKGLPLAVPSVTLVDRAERICMRLVRLSKAQKGGVEDSFFKGEKAFVTPQFALSYRREPVDSACQVWGSPSPLALFPTLNAVNNSACPGTLSLTLV